MRLYNVCDFISIKTLVPVRRNLQKIVTMHTSDQFCTTNISSTACYLMCSLFFLYLIELITHIR